MSQQSPAAKSATILVVDDEPSIIKLCRALLQPEGYTILEADGSSEAAARLSRVLRNDPGMGVIRHADAGYDIARETASTHHLDIQERIN